MRKLSLTLLIILLPVPAVYGDVFINGYFEPQFSGTVLDDEFLQLNSNKLRIDLSSDLSNNITFTGNFNYTNYNGHTGWNLLDFVPDKLAAFVKEESAQAYSFECEDEDELDNAYLRLHSKVFTLTVGRQQISVGSGYAWNPTDLFNTKDVLDPTYEQPGVNGLRLDIGLSADYTMVMFYSPKDTWEKSGKLLRFLGRISHFDYALSAGQRQQTYTDFTNSHKQEKRQDMLGFDLNGEFLGLGCWSENAYSFMENFDDYWADVIGIDYTFSSGWYMMAEYYHNEQGRKDYSQYSFNDWLRYLMAETRTLARDQLYSYTFYPITDLIDVGGSVVYSISDNSLLLIPTCEYSISDEVTLTFFGSIYTGKQGTMYSEDMGNGGIIRLRAYF